VTSFVTDAGLWVCVHIFTFIPKHIIWTASTPQEHSVFNYVHVAAKIEDSYKIDWNAPSKSIRPRPQWRTLRVDPYLRACFDLQLLAVFYTWLSCDEDCHVDTDMEVWIIRGGSRGYKEKGRLRHKVIQILNRTSTSNIFTVLPIKTLLRSIAWRNTHSYTRLCSHAISLPIQAGFHFVERAFPFFSKNFGLERNILDIHSQNGHNRLLHLPCCTGLPFTGSYASKIPAPIRRDKQ
jgi:hypothetical protein